MPVPGPGRGPRPRDRGRVGQLPRRPPRRQPGTSCRSRHRSPPGVSCVGTVSAVGEGVSGVSGRATPSAATIRSSPRSPRRTVYSPATAVRPIPADVDRRSAAALQDCSSDPRTRRAALRCGACGRGGEELKWLLGAGGGVGLAAVELRDALGRHRHGGGVFDRERSRSPRPTARTGPRRPPHRRAPGAAARDVLPGRCRRRRRSRGRHAWPSPRSGRCAGRALRDGRVRGR